MKDIRLTVAQLEKICKAHKYILCRDQDGELFGMNCGLGNLARRIKNLRANDKTQVISYTPCDLMTYITYKIPLSL